MHAKAILQMSEHTTAKANVLSHHDIKRMFPPKLYTLFLGSYHTTVQNFIEKVLYFFSYPADRQTVFVSKLYAAFLSQKTRSISGTV